MAKFTHLIAALALWSDSVAAVAPRPDVLTLDYSYDQYLLDFKKKASPDGASLFAKRLKEVVAHNAQPGKTYVLGVNAFTDQPSPPKGRRADPHASKVHVSADTMSPSDAMRQAAFEKLVADPSKMPAAVDWRAHVPTVVSPVKNQGHCGSCWAFATTAVVESAVALASGELFSLSPQQLVACAANDPHCGGVGGCMGSVPQLAYDYLIDAGGYAEEWSFPYVSYSGATNGTCLPLNDGTTTTQAGITGYVTLDTNNATAVMAAVATIGPLAINVDASTWHAYDSGVYDGCSYDNMDLDHVVTLVGYGTDAELGDYWLVRNSWSPAWGEAGYIRLKRDPLDATPCGVDNTPLDGTGCTGGPAVQYPCGQCGTVFDVSYPTGAYAGLA